MKKTVMQNYKDIFNLNFKEVVFMRTTVPSLFYFSVAARAVFAFLSLPFRLTQGSLPSAPAILQEFSNEQSTQTEAMHST